MDRREYRITTNSIQFRVEEREILQPFDTRPVCWSPAWDELGPYKTLDEAAQTLKRMRRQEAEAALPWVEVQEW